MVNATNYLAGRTGTSLSTFYRVTGIPASSIRRRAADSIIDRGTPAIIGTGWLHHYPLAYGYAQRVGSSWGIIQTRRFFFVNQGMAGSNNGWVQASTWFAGEIYP